MSQKLPSFANASQAIHASMVALGEQGAGLRDILTDAAETVSVPPSRVSASKHGPSLDNPMGRICILLHSVARGINAGEGLTRQSPGGFYTCMRVMSELCEQAKQPDASAEQVYAGFRARAGVGAHGSRGALGTGDLPSW